MRNSKQARQNGPQDPRPTDVVASKTNATLRVASEPTGKIGVLVTMLCRAEGATIAAMMTATGWQAHSIRGALSGSVKKALGLTLLSTLTDTGRVYRIVEGQAS